MYTPIRRATSILVAIALALGAAACGDPASEVAAAPGDAASAPHPAPTRAHGGNDDRTGEHRAEARIYAAASLTGVIDALRTQFEPLRGSRLVPSYGASGTLAQQIRDGAAPGVFVSASEEWADELESWGLVEPGSRIALAGNSLVVIVPKGASDRPSTLAGLAEARFARVALADPAAVPAGRYAKAALEKAGVFGALAAKVVAAQDVRTALTYVERGEAAAGIVYATDAAASDGVDVAFRVPAELHPKIVYPMVLVTGANRRARELHAFLQTPEAWAAFEKAGFVRP